VLTVLTAEGVNSVSTVC